MFEFLPKKEYREFNAKSIVGKMVNLKLCHFSENKKTQYINSVKCDLHVSGWVNTIGEIGEVIKRKVKDAYIMQHNNGGRSDYRHYDSWKDYFSESKKEKVQRYWKADLFDKINSGDGDVDTIDLIVEFKDFQLSCTMWDHSAPEEWYSEMHKKKFSFKEGFFETAEEAKESFINKSHDDLFGERYFPVVVFNKNIDRNKMGDVLYCAKSHSKPIETKDYIVFGTRCKPSEYSSLIAETYLLGGKVAKNKEWDWE